MSPTEPTRTDLFRPETLAVCVATYRRAWRLKESLAGLANQRRPADEIVVSDAGHDRETGEVIQGLADHCPRTRVAHCLSPSKALPGQRWFAFGHTTSDLILFLDDDVVLEETALERLVTAYRRCPQARGIGYPMARRDGSLPIRPGRTWRERWLGTHSVRAGLMTRGGLTVSLAGLEGQGLVEVDHLWGGAMSFRRAVLEAVGRLNGLIQLYDQGIGRGEDAVLSAAAGKLGPLYAINEPLARHPDDSELSPTPYARGGWRRGVTGTWTRGKVMRWLARAPRSWVGDWIRVASLELVRAGRGIVGRPWAADRWFRLAGAVYGAGMTVLTLGSRHDGPDVSMTSPWGPRMPRSVRGLAEAGIAPSADARAGRRPTVC